MTTAALRVSKQDIDSYRRDGAVCLRGLISPAWLDALREGVEKNLRSPSPEAQVYSEPGEPGFFMHDYDLWKRIPSMRDFTFESPLAAVAGKMMGAGQVNLLNELVTMKEPGTANVTDWHQDYPYFAVDGDQVCATWVPLIAISPDNALEFVKGSHRWGRAFAPIDSQLDGTPYRGEEFELVPDIESRRGDYDILSWELEPGDCVVFHLLTLHKGKVDPKNTVPRRAVSHRWLGDDAVYAVRVPEAEFPKVKPKLEDGEPMRNAADFPLIWKAPDRNSPAQN
ncbi:MAG: phytanoyl-CoA dioxygenase family protein [Alphaproteobacteria bacterium]